jgi:prepilin-type processing-associated H-X9-DG protein
MLRILRAGVLTTATFLTATAGFTAAAPLADRVPSGAEVYLGWNGSPLTWQGYQTSHFRAVLQKNQLPSMMDSYVQRLLLHLGESKPAAGVIARMIWVPLRSLWNSKVAIYVDGLDRSHPGMPIPRLGIIAVGSKTNNRRLLRTFSAIGLRMNAEAPAGHPLVEVGKSTDGVYLLLDPTAKMRSLAKGAGPVSLATNKAFGQCSGEVEKNGGLVAYANIRQMMADVQSLPPIQNPSTQKTFAALMLRLHINQANRFVASAGFSHGHMLYSAFISNLQRKAMRPSNARQALMTSMLDDVPAGATTVELGGNKIATIVNGYLALGALSPRKSAKFRQFMTKLNEAAGFRIRTDLINALGNASLMYCDPSIGGSTALGAVWEFRPQHPNKISTEISSLVRAANRAIEKQMQTAHSGSALSLRFKVIRISADGVVFHYLDSPLISPTWCVDGHRLIMTWYPQVMAAAITRLDEPGKNITSNPHFIHLVKELGGIDHFSSLDFENLHAQVAANYLRVLEFQRMIFGLGDIMLTPSPGMLIPTLAELRKDLSVSGSKSWMGRSGWHWVAVSPFPGSSVFCSDSLLGSVTSTGISADSMMVAILLPSLARAKELANRAVSSANERSILQGAFIYAQSHGGMLPPNLSVLVADKYISPKTLVSPGSGETPAQIVFPKSGGPLNPATVARELMGHFSYAYVGHGINTNTLSNPSRFAVIFDFSELQHKHGCNVGFADGHVSWVPESHIPALVAQQNAYRQKHHLPLLP